MPTIRFNPLWELDQLSNQFDKFVKQNLTGANKPRVSFNKFVPRVDILEDENNIYFEVELPGIKKEEVKVSVDQDRILSIKGVKDFDRDTVKTCCKNERDYGQFTRSFQLPELVNSEKIDARFDKGILFLNIPKIEPAKPKEQTIEIK